MKNLNQLKTFEGACKVEGLNAKKVIPNFSCYPAKDRKSMETHAKLVIIVRAANRIANGGKEWKPDFDNYEQKKYEIWFYKDKGSSGFRFYGDDLWNASSYVGSRLCFISREAAEHVGKTFVDLYKQFMVIE